MPIRLCLLIAPQFSLLFGNVCFHSDLVISFRCVRIHRRNLLLIRYLIVVDELHEFSFSILFFFSIFNFELWVFLKPFVRF